MATPTPTLLLLLKGNTFILFKDLQSALRRAGQNPTESEVQDMINKIDDGSASLAFADFCLLIGEKAKELDPETHFKDILICMILTETGEKLYLLRAHNKFSCGHLTNIRGCINC